MTSSHSPFDPSPDPGARAAAVPPPRTGVPAGVARRARWERIGLGIRLAYNPRKPDVVRLWIGIGMTLAGDGPEQEAAILRRMVRLLLQVAHDPALPWYWRSVCLELATRPLSRLLTVLRSVEPTQADDWHTEVELARRRLDAVPPGQRHAFEGMARR